MEILWRDYGNFTQLYDDLTTHDSYFRDYTCLLDVNDVMRKPHTIGAILEFDYERVFLRLQKNSLLVQGIDTKGGLRQYMSDKLVTTMEHQVKRKKGNYQLAQHWVDYYYNIDYVANEKPLQVQTQKPTNVKTKVETKVESKL